MFLVQIKKMNFAQGHKSQWKRGKLLLVQKDHSLGQLMTKVEDSEIGHNKEEEPYLIFQPFGT